MLSTPQGQYGIVAELPMSTLTQCFAAHMRFFREQQGLSQQALADLLDTDRNTISRTEREAPNLALPRAQAIANALQVPLESMFGEAPRKRRKAEPLGPSLGSRVRALREAKDWNQRELAERLNVDRNWVSSMERGASTGSLETLEKFAQALGVTPGTLL